MHVAERIITALKAAIDTGFYPSGSVLPSMATLAKQWATSKRTVASAIGSLAAQGVLTSVNKVGVFVGRPQLPLVPPPRRPRWLEIAEDLNRRIGEGLWKSGEFIPTVAGLQLEYNVSWAIVHRAMVHLVGLQVLTREGRAYRVKAKPISIGRRGMLPVFLIQGEPKLMSLFSKAPHAEYLQGIEKELQRLSIPCLSKSIRDAFTINTRNCLGILYMPSLNKEQTRSDIAVLAEKEIPTGYYLYRSKFGFKFRRKNHFFINRNNEGGGRAVGEFLKVKGHINIAFLTTHLSEEWSVSRLRGLVAAGLKVYCVEEDLGIDTTNYNPGPRFEEILNRSLQDLESRSMGGFRNDFRQSLLQIAFQREIYERMEPHFKALASRKPITAWVGVNDNLILQAQAFWDTKGNEPKKPVLVGFDNTWQSHAREMTSYDFRVTDLGYLAVHALLRDIPVTVDRNGVLSTTGTLIIREPSDNQVERGAARGVSGLFPP